jgi:hypothetical protein
MTTGAKMTTLLMRSLATSIALLLSAALAHAQAPLTTRPSLIDMLAANCPSPRAIIGGAAQPGCSNVALTNPASLATLTLLAGKTLTVNNTVTFTATDGSTVTFGGGGTVAYTSNNLSAFAATTSAQLAGVLSDETGTGVAVFSISPALTGTPTAPTATPGTNTTQLATTAYADAIAALKANIASPAFTGTLTVPTLAATTINAFTLSGTVSGGGNQINNVVIGATTPLAGTHTTLQANTSVNVGAAVTPDALVTANANTVATVAPNTAVQVHAVGADNAFAGFAMDAFGSGFQNVVTARLSYGTATSKSSVNAAAFIQSIGAQAWDGTAYASIATLDFATANAQTVSDHGGFVRIRTVPAGSTTLAESMRWQPSGGVTIGVGITDPGIKNLGVGGAVATAIPVTLTGTSGSVGVSDSSIIVNASGTFTLTLPTAATYPGRWLNLKSIAAQTVNSASSNVVPLAGGAAGTALLTATAGKWAGLQSDGTNWILMSAN